MKMGQQELLLRMNHMNLNEKLSGKLIYYKDFRLNY